MKSNLSIRFDDKDLRAAKKLRIELAPLCRQALRQAIMRSQAPALKLKGVKVVAPRKAK